jgi:hypothetical protein
MATFGFSAALNHPIFWKNHLESADALRLIIELGWPIPPSFEDTLMQAFVNLNATTPSIVEHTFCSIIKALGQQLSVTMYAECCTQLCIKYADELRIIADRHGTDSRKTDSSIFLAVPIFVSNVLEACPLLLKVMSELFTSLSLHILPSEIRAS